MKPTISIRRALVDEEQWLDTKGQWGPFKKRKRFNDRKGNAQDNAEAFVIRHFGKDFLFYGLFPNS